MFLVLQPTVATVMTKPSWCAIKTIKSFLSKRKERKKHNQHCLPGVNPSYNPLSHEFVSSLTETYLSIFAWKLSERNPFKASFSHPLVDTLFCPLVLLPFSYPGKTCQRLSKRLIWQGAWMYSSLYLWKYCKLFYNRLCQPDVRSKILEVRLGVVRLSTFMLLHRHQGIHTSTGLSYDSCSVSCSLCLQLSVSVWA